MVTPATTRPDTVPDAAATYVIIAKGICMFNMYVYYSKIANLAIDIPYNGNYPRKKTFANYLLCHSS